MYSFTQLNDFPILLAPMVGLSHAALRKTLDKYYPLDSKVLTPTEMLNSRRIPGQVLGQTPQTVLNDFERSLQPQILGNEEKYIRMSVQKLHQWGAKAIDINMGCPVAKALKHNYGVALMGDINYASEVVKFAVKDSPIPVSVKLRAGTQNDEDYLLKFCDALINSGASWLCLHPRLAADKRKGQADWSQIKKLKDTFQVPIIGNGDIQCYQDIIDMKSETNCDAVMIGRALTAKPWLITKYAYENGFPLTPDQYKLIPQNPQDEFHIYCDYLIDFIKNCFLLFEANDALKRIRFFVRVGHVWLNFGHSFVKAVHKYSSEQEMIDFILTKRENTSITLSKRTSLRY